MKVLKDPTKPKKNVKFGYVEYKGFTKKHGLDDAPPIRDYSVFGNVSPEPNFETRRPGSPKPDFEIRRPESPQINILYQESPAKSRDLSIYQKETPKKRKLFNSLFNLCLSEPETD